MALLELCGCKLLFTLKGLNSTFDLLFASIANGNVPSSHPTFPLPSSPSQRHCPLSLSLSLLKKPEKTNRKLFQLKLLRLCVFSVQCSLFTQYTDTYIHTHTQTHTFYLELRSIFLFLMKLQHHPADPYQDHFAAVQWDTACMQDAEACLYTAVRVYKVHRYFSF